MALMWNISARYGKMTFRRKNMYSTPLCVLSLDALSLVSLIVPPPRLPRCIWQCRLAGGGGGGCQRWGAADGRLPPGRRTGRSLPSKLAQLAQSALERGGDGQ